MVKASKQEIRKLTHMARTGELDAVTVQGIIDGRLVALNKVPSSLVERAEITRLTIPVDRSLAVDDLMRRGYYNRVKDDLTSQNFPLTPGRGIKQVDMMLVGFRRWLYTKQVYQAIAELGLKPARIEHLLSLGLELPKLQCKFRIAALGSIHEDEHGDAQAPMLWSFLGGSRDVSLTSCAVDHKWSFRYRFLCQPGESAT